MGHWSLRIKSVRDEDKGLYECQLSIHPTQSIYIELKVVGTYMHVHSVYSLIVIAVDRLGHCKPFANVCEHLNCFCVHIVRVCLARADAPLLASMCLFAPYKNSIRIYYSCKVVETFPFRIPIPQSKNEAPHTHTDTAPSAHTAFSLSPPIVRHVCLSRLYVIVTRKSYKLLLFLVICPMCRSRGWYTWRTGFTHWWRFYTAVRMQTQTSNRKSSICILVSTATISPPSIPIYHTHGAPTKTMHAHKNRRSFLLDWARERESERRRTW